MSEAAVSPGFSRLLSDERLTKRAVSGDERAFAAIFRRYHQPLYRFCLAIVGNSEDAQDALQNAMIKVLRALPGEEREIELKPWLYRIAHNESIDLLRRRRETRELSVEQPAPGYGLAEDAETRERLRRLIADLRELPERQREVLVMRELAGLDFEEIGTALSTSGAVARQTLYEARQSLRQMEEGREMSCEAVMKALSDGDGRVTRRRDVRAHLRSCAACGAFRDEIKSRQHDLASLSPLPAVAAAGILQGLVGGSSAATGGGLAAVLGGGAAQGISASAVAKGVATVAVATTVGVTAADRSGVIHVLPGSGEASPSRSAPAGHDHRSDHDDGGSHAGSGAGHGKGPAGAQGKGQGEGKGQGDRSADRKRGAGAGIGNHGQGAKAQPGSKGYGPGVSHPSGRDHEKQHPPAATKGQETSAANKPPPPLPPAAADGAGGPPATPPKPPKPEAAPSSPPREAPSSPPAAAPATPPQQAAPPPPPAQTQAAAEAPAPAAPSKGAGKGSGKSP